MENILILGAGYAGMMTALRLAGKDKHNAVKVTVVNGVDTFTERIRLHQVVTKQTLKTRSIPHMLRGKGIDFVQGWINRIDLEAKSVQLVDGRSLNYDRLVYALGSHIDLNSVPGVREHTYRLDPSGPRSAAELANILPGLNKSGGHVVICGGGLTGIEGITEIAEQYPNLQVTMVTKGAIGAHLSQKGRAYILKVFEGLGIQVMKGTITEIKANQVQLEDGSTLPFDACLWAGSFAVPALAREAGLKVNKNGQILIDRTMRSFSHPEVYAIGDAATFTDPAVVPIRMSCNAAMPMGAHAADSVLAHTSGKTAHPFLFAYAGQCISLGRHNGLVQLVKSDDSAKERILTGRTAAFIKEKICQFTMIVLRIERVFPGAFMWLKHEQEVQEVEIKDAAEFLGSL